MEIRTLRCFLTVAREENMSRAAEQLHVTQLTVSKALKSLEDELGKRLRELAEPVYAGDSQKEEPGISARCKPVNSTVVR